MSFTFPVTLSLYAVAWALYLAHAATSTAAEPSPSGGRLARAARLVLTAAFLLHAFDIGAHCVRAIHPFVNAREALSFVGWLTIGAYLGVSLRQPLPLVGALLVPVVIVLESAARLTPERGASTAASILGKLHIGLATIGVAVFAVAAVLAAVYLVAERQLKHRRFGALFRQGPPLAMLDGLNRRSILVGFPIFTVAMVTGAIWVMRLPEGGPHRLLRPEYALSTITWCLYAALLLARLVAGWRGRRAALVTLLGFGAALGVLAIYLLRSPAAAGLAGGG